MKIQRIARAGVKAGIAGEEMGEGSPQAVLMDMGNVMTGV